MESNPMFCQSCSMPLQQASDHGTNADGTASQDYCQYCYQNGAFTSDETMEEMIESCADHWQGFASSREDGIEKMRQIFPQLKRWASA